jgi:phospholipase C
MEYTVFDSWHAAVPGPTMPNRAFAAAATSHGMGNSDVEMIAKGLPSKTMFRQIEEMGLDYRIYFELVPALLMFKDLRHKDARPRFHGLKNIY